MHSRGYGYIGAVKSNRLGCCQVTAGNIGYLSKQSRGSIDYKLDRKSGYIAATWSDSRLIDMISSVLGVNEIGSCSMIQCDRHHEHCSHVCIQREQVSSKKEHRQYV